MHIKKRMVPMLYSFAFFMLVAIAVLAVPELSRSLGRTDVVLAATNNVASSASDSIAIYPWNLTDGGQPLISLPDHIGAGVDLSLSYSLDQFEFPLFQSLYYNESARKYILMVIAKQGRRAQFLDLNTTPRQSVTGAELKLSENGRNKLLRTKEGTVYTFAPLGDGELHCSQIKDCNGLIIKLHYNRQASLEQIDDASGRRIEFSYSDDYVSAITQVWGPSAIKKQTWAVTDDRTLLAQPIVSSSSTATVPKHIPSNATKPGYTAQMAAEDLTLAAIFGGPGGVAAANGFEPTQLGSQYPLYRGDLIGDDGLLRRGHLSFAMHLYGNAEGTGDLALYVPAGFTSHSLAPTPTDAAVTFYYPRLGRLTDVTLAVFHVADFQLTDEGTRVRIGNIGGRGGSVGTYKHSHIEFYRGNTGGLPSLAARSCLRIDPATVFAATPEASARAGVAQSDRGGY
ncbi:MAG: hypothetical protein QOF62_108 [Pyrinomonadaceae bacterium]|jgi:hypothetical protein|nr:hypothetical protein [Pyrinomonadaceae bacterium]